MGNKLKVGIFGAFGEVGRALFTRLSQTRHFLPNLRSFDPIERIYLEVKEHHEKETYEIEASSRFRQIPVSNVCISDEGYSQFNECDVILIAAGAKMPEEWIHKERLANGSYNLKDLEKRINEGGFYTREEIKDVYDTFQIMRDLPSEVKVGYRAFEYFPRNVPIMKKYARELKDMGFEGLTIILSNVPDYCCNVFSGTAPELTGRTMGMCNIDTMRLVYEVLDIESSSRDLPPFVRIIIPIIGNHDENMIFCPELMMHHYTEGRIITYEEREFMNNIIYEIRKELLEGSPTDPKSKRSRIQKIIKEYAPKNKEIRENIITDATEATIQILEEIYQTRLYGEENYRNILTNSIFHELDKANRTGVFVTLPHTMNDLEIKKYDYKDRISLVTDRELKKCINGHKIMTETFYKKGIIDGMPAMPEEPVNGREFIYLRDPGIEGLIIVKCKKEIIPHQKVEESVLNICDMSTGSIIENIPADNVSHVYARDDELLIIREWGKSRKEKTGQRGIDSAIERWRITQNKTGDILQTEAEKLGEVNLDRVLSHSFDIFSEEVYVASNKQKHGVLVFDGAKTSTSPVKLYGTKENSPIYSVAVYELPDFTHKNKGNKTFVFGGSDNCVYMWNKDVEKEIQFKGADEIIDGKIKVAGNYLFAGGFDKVHIWDLENPTEYRSVDTFNGEFDVQVSDGNIELAVIDDKNKSVNIFEFDGIRTKTLYSKKFDGRPTSVKMIGDNMVVMKKRKPYHYRKEDTGAAVIPLEIQNCDFSIVEYMVKK